MSVFWISAAWLRRNCQPSDSSAKKPRSALPTRGAASRTSGATEMPASRAADRTYVAESATKARARSVLPAPRKATKSPARGKPARSAIVSAVQVALLAAIRSSLATMRGMKATLAGRKKRLTQVIRNTSGKTSRMLVAAAKGSASTSAARIRSLAIITRLCSQRSTNVPAIGPRSRLGSVAARKTKPVSSGESVRP